MNIIDSVMKNALPLNTNLNQYIITEYISFGGFSFVYTANDTTNNRKVVIKEYFPHHLAVREDDIVQNRDEKSQPWFDRGIKAFRNEIEVLTKVKHLNIIELLDSFELNSTVYTVMPYISIEQLNPFASNPPHPMHMGFISTIFNPIVSAISTMHSNGYVHLDIKPFNILITNDHTPVLIDFGTSLSYPNTNNHVSTTCPGFSPIECYNDTINIGPWSDVYMLGATFRSFVERTMLPSAEERIINDTLPLVSKRYKKKYPDGFLKMIDRSMAIDPKDRLQNIDELLQVFND